jgi:hypothetical protein
MTPSQVLRVDMAQQPSVQIVIGTLPSIVQRDGLHSLAQNDGK